MRHIYRTATPVRGCDTAAGSASAPRSSSTARARRPRRAAAARRPPRARTTGSQVPCAAAQPTPTPGGYSGREQRAARRDRAGHEREHERRDEDRHAERRAESCRRPASRDRPLPHRHRGSILSRSSLGASSEGRAADRPRLLDCCAARSGGGVPDGGTMSEVAAKPARPRRGRRFDLLAMLAIGVVIVAAALLPAVTANSGGTTTVRGDVTVDGTPLAVLPGRLLDDGDGVKATTTRTDANGGFTLDVSDTIDGYAYAGTTPGLDARDPRDRRAARWSAACHRHADRTDHPLYQGRHDVDGEGARRRARPSCTSALQEAGRITGTSPVLASGLRAIQIRRADNSVVQTLKLDAKSRFQSMLLAPGQYGVVLVPKSPGPADRRERDRASGATTDGDADPAGDGRDRARHRPHRDRARSGPGCRCCSSRTATCSRRPRPPRPATGRSRASPRATTRSRSGRFDEPAATVRVRLVDRRADPGCEPLADRRPRRPPRPSPSATATTPQAAAIEPVQRTADAVLPQTFAVTVPDVLGEVSVGTQVQQAGRLTGFVTVAARRPPDRPGADPGRGGGGGDRARRPRRDGRRRTGATTSAACSRASATASTP